MGVRLVGSLDRPDMEELRVALDSFTRERPLAYLFADLKDTTGISAEARKYMATWSRERNTGVMAATVVYGVGFTMRAIITLALNAIKLLGNLNSDIQFVRDEAEARRWTAEHRAGPGPRSKINGR